MGEFDNEYVWVYLEVTDYSSQKHYRGRVRRTDYDALLEGRYVKPFLTVEHTFWTKDDGFVLAGRGESQRHRFAGTFHFTARFVTTIAPLTDCTDLFLMTAAHDTAASAWEQASLPGSLSVGAEEATAPQSRPRNRKKSA